MGSTSHLLRSELLAGVLLLVVSGIGYFFVKLYNARKIVWEYQKRGLPVAPGHSFLFGHLLLMKETLDTLPPKCHYYYAMKEIGSKYFEKEGCYYLDTWPVGELGLINVSPQIAPQSLQTGTISLNRPNMLPRFFKPIAGGRNLFDLQEKEWRPWRAVFVKGFSPEHLSSLVPGMVKETLTYCTTLEKQAAKGSFFSLDLTTLRFTIDLIGKTVLYVWPLALSLRADFKQKHLTGRTKGVQHPCGLYAQSNSMASG